MNRSSLLLAESADSGDDESSVSSSRKRTRTTDDAASKKRVVDSDSDECGDVRDDTDTDTDSDTDSDESDESDALSATESTNASSGRAAVAAGAVPWRAHDATIAQHFVLLSQLSTTLRAEFGSALQNMAKNRYQNVLANDDTRVKLAVDDADYVNANFTANGRFIATQAPLPDTVADFWTMLLEQRTRVIVCLTKFDATRAFDYVPAVHHSQRHGRISVHTRGAVHYGDDLMVRYLLVQRDSDAAPRGIVHLQFTAWPDFGVPDSHEPVLRLHALMHAFRSTLAACDTDLTAPYAAVHCSAGIGRAGTFIAASALIEQLVAGGAGAGSLHAALPQAPTPMTPAHRAFVERIVSTVEISPAVFGASGDVRLPPVAAPAAPSSAFPVPTTNANNNNANNAANNANNETKPAAGIFADWAQQASRATDADASTSSSSSVSASSRPCSPLADTPPMLSPHLSETPPLMSAAAADAVAVPRLCESPPLVAAAGPPSPQLLSCVFQTVLGLRKARRGCVQTLPQYQYVCSIVNSVEKFLRQAHDAPNV